MFIAISGTHGSGKSSLVKAFLASHPEYFLEPEAYEALEDLHGESFSAEPSSEHYVIRNESCDWFQSSFRLGSSNNPR